MMVYPYLAAEVSLYLCDKQLLNIFYAFSFLPSFPYTENKFLVPKLWLSKDDNKDVLFIVCKHLIIYTIILLLLLNTYLFQK